jgi:tetratricopeptide (TPR) repeat protein
MQYVCNEVSRLFLQAGYPQLSAAVQANPVSYLIETGQIEQAHQHLMAYERGSGFFDKDNNIQPGREIYYYHKGIYCLATCQYDSAEYYFRKELRLGKDFNNQNSASRGLSLLFQKTHRPDSAAKYALYSYEMNDSMHFHKYAHEISRMRTLYDYSRFQHQAMQEKEKAERFNLYFLVSVFSFVVLVLITFVAGYVLVQKKRRLEERIELLRGYAVNQNLRDSPIAQQFRELLRTNPYHQPELKDWKDLSAVIDREAPHFHKTLCQGDVQLSDFEYDVCMLIKIQIPLSDIARLKQCVPSYITQTRKHIFQKLFKKKGRADELDEYIMKLS